MNNKKNVLGKGLDAILGSPYTDITSNDISGNFVAGAIANILIKNIECNPFQPRDTVENDDLLQLAESIKQQGIIQPVTVRKLGYNKYQLISGERRLKASTIAGLTAIPSYIKIADDKQMLEMSLIENIQRKDLNAIEIAISYKRLIEECKFTYKEISEHIGKDRTTISNYIRLLKLPDEIQVAIRNNKISMGHARALINVDNIKTQLKIFNAIITQNLSVHKVEEIVGTINNPSENNLSDTDKKNVLSYKYETIKSNLTDMFNTKVKLKINNKGKGNIVIPFDSDKDFERIIKLISK